LVSTHSEGKYGLVETIGSRSAQWALGGLLGLAALGCGWAALVLPATNRPADVVAFLVVFGALFALLGPAFAAARALAVRHPRRTAVWILAGAALLRLLLLPAGLPAEGRLRALGRDLTGAQSGAGAGYGAFLLYDNDVWRYLWDGRLQAVGLSPYALTPNEVAARAEDGDLRAAAVFADVADVSDIADTAGATWSDVFDHLSFRSHRTVYPPLAQLAFRAHHALAPGSVFAWKLALALLDLATCGLLLALLRRLGRGPEEALLYAWNPLALKEIAGSGHVDGVAVFLLVAAVYLLVARRPAAGLAVFAGAVLAKLAPAVLAGLVLRRVPVRLWPVGAAVLAAGAWPFLGDLAGLAGGLAVYAREWTFNAGPWAVVAWLAGQAGVITPGAWASALCGGAVLGLAAAVTLRDRGSDDDLIQGAFLLLAALVLLAPAVMPWYLLWALPFAVLSRHRSWTALTGLALLSYLTYLFRAEHLWWRWAEYGSFAVLAAWEAWRSRSLTRAGSPQVGLDPLRTIEAVSTLRQKRTISEDA
jgi:hypothetical protein